MLAAAAAFISSSLPPLAVVEVSAALEDGFVIVTNGLAGIRAGGGVNASFARRARMVAK